MEINAGHKELDKERNVPGYKDVWFDPTAVSNLFSPSEMVKRGHRIVFDSNWFNGFMVYMKR